MVVRDTLANVNSRDEKYHPLRACKPGSNAGHFLEPIGEASNVVARRRKQ